MCNTPPNVLHTCCCPKVFHLFIDICQLGVGNFFGAAHSDNAPVTLAPANPNVLHNEPASSATPLNIHIWTKDGRLPTRQDQCCSWLIPPHAPTNIARPINYANRCQNQSQEACNVACQWLANGSNKWAASRNEF